MKFKNWNKDKILKCEKCSDMATERHHIVYNMLPGTGRHLFNHPMQLHISLLCIPCHKLITTINTKYARLIRKKLSDIRRLYIWGQFIQNKVHPSWSQI